MVAVPLPRAATRLQAICGAPFGRGARRPSALLQWLDAGPTMPAPMRLAASVDAELPVLCLLTGPVSGIAGDFTLHRTQALMAHVLALDKKYDMTSNVFCMTANPFQCPDTQHNIDHMPDAARVFHQKGR